MALCLGSIKIYDKYTASSYYPCLITPLRPAGTNEQTRQNTTNTNTHTDLVGDEPFFSFAFEYNAPNSPHYYNIKLQMLPLEVVYRQSFLVQIASFFSSTSATLMELQPAARLRLELLRVRTASKITDDLDSYKSIGLDVNISAPKILIPENILVKDTPVLLIDLGNIAIRTEQRKEAELLDSKLSKEAIEKMSVPEIKEELKKRGADTNGTKPELVQRLISTIFALLQNDPNSTSTNLDQFYDRFRLRLSSLQLIMSATGKVKTKMKGKKKKKKKSFPRFS